VDHHPAQSLVLGIPVHAVEMARAVDIVFDWAARRESRTVCLCNVDSLMRARRDGSHHEALGSADLVLPDGAPVAWALRRLLGCAQERVAGPDMMWACCAEAARQGTPIFLLGGAPETLRRLEVRLQAAFAGLHIAGTLAPPFRPLTEAEDARVVYEINESGAKIVWVGLGCPKQEAWLRAHRGRIHATMVGVGAAFDFHAGTLKRAPVWMQRRGLEWLYRLGQDPRRLARRYVVGNSLFAAALIARGASGRRLSHD
jgi:N-acetylglucosaminyldiphosphoundecaprenol N-acetyl-beta-D-mannosaminyltransferase